MEIKQKEVGRVKIGKQIHMNVFKSIIFVILVMQTGLMRGQTMDKKFDLATFGGGCFWCVEAIFERVKGVEKAVSGYSGGDRASADYKQVSAGNSGHAEVVNVHYDSNQISYLELLEIFFKTHDPTTLNRQGADVGTQYRSVIFYRNEEERSLSQDIISSLDAEAIWNNPIVTVLEPFEEFYPAETYHQEYFENNPNQGYCRIVINPKVDKFEKMFREKMK